VGFIHSFARGNFGVELPFLEMDLAKWMIPMALSLNASQIALYRAGLISNGGGAYFSGCCLIIEQLGLWFSASQAYMIFWFIFGRRPLQNFSQLMRSQQALWHGMNVFPGMLSGLYPGMAWLYWILCFGLACHVPPAITIAASVKYLGNFGKKAAKWRFTSDDLRNPWN